MKNKNLIAVSALTLMSSLDSFAQNCDPASFELAQTFVTQLNMDPDFSVDFIGIPLGQENFAIIFDPLTDSFDAINLDLYQPTGGSETAEYYYGSSTRGFFDLTLSEGSAGMADSFLEEGSGLVFEIKEDHFCNEENIYISSLSSIASVQSLSRQLPMMTFNGTHQGILMDTPLDQSGWNTWASGGFSRHSGLDARQTIGEIGTSIGFADDSLRFGLGLGYGHVDQDLSFGGGSDLEGEFFLAELDYRVPDSKLILSGLVYYGQWDAEITRGYLVGNTLNQSRANTDIDSFAIRLRADWKDLFQVGEVSVSPRISYSFIETQSDRFDEIGGGVPASFRSQRSSEHEIRIGTDFNYQLGERTGLQFGLEVVKRFEDESDVEGAIDGVGSFRIDGEDLESVWGRANLQVTHLIGDSQLLNLSMNGSTDGGEANWGVFGGYSFAF